MLQWHKQKNEEEDYGARIIELDEFLEKIIEESLLKP